MGEGRGALGLLRALVRGDGDRQRLEEVLEASWIEWPWLRSDEPVGGRGGGLVGDGLVAGLGLMAKQLLVRSCGLR